MSADGDFANEEYILNYSTDDALVRAAMVQPLINQIWLEQKIIAVFDLDYSLSGPYDYKFNPCDKKTPDLNSQTYCSGGGLPARPVQRQRERLLRGLRPR